MTDKISLAFNDLTAGQARVLLEAYAAMQAQPQAQPQPQAQSQAQPVAMQAQPQAQPVAMQPQPQPQAQPAADVDVDGVPYNPDLHANREAASGGKSQDGRWRLKRGAERKDYLAWRDRHTAAAAPVVDLRAQHTVVNGVPPFAPALQDPGRDAVMAKAGELSTRGLLTAPAVAEIMRRAGTQDNMELVNDPGKRAIAWAAMLDLEAAAAQVPG